MANQIFVFKTAMAPSKESLQSIRSNCGGARFAYNYMLNLNKQKYQNYQNGLGEKPSTTFFSLRKQWNVEKHSVAPWWSENDYNAYASSMESLSKAFKNFFSPQRSQYPKYKKSNDRQSYSTERVQLVDNGSSVKLAKVGKVKLHERLKSADWLLRCGASLQLATVSIDRSGKIYVSIRLKVPDKLALQFLKGKFSRKGSGFIGVDLGLKEFLTTSDGQVVSNPKFYRNLELKLSKAQASLSQKADGSKSKLRARLKVNRIHQKIENRRTDFQWKTARELVQYNSGIVIESLSVLNMLKNHNLAKSISDASWGTFAQKLKYLGNRYGSNIIEANQWFASSKKCSFCNQVKTKLRLNEREFHCDYCGLCADRDWNAAENLRRWGIDALRYSESLNGGDSRQTAVLRQ